MNFVEIIIKKSTNTQFRLMVINYLNHIKRKYMMEHQVQQRLLTRLKMLNLKSFMLQMEEDLLGCGLEFPNLNNR